MKRGQITFYRSFWEAVQRLRKKEDRLSILEAIVAYGLDGETRPMTDVAEGIFVLIKPTLDSSFKKSENGRIGGSKAEANGKQSGSKSKPEANGKLEQGESAREKEKEEEKEDEVEVEGEGENECSPPPEGPPPPAPEQSKPQARRKHGAYGWVRLTQTEYDRLVAELGPEELARCIRYVDESAQKSGNKNRWKDWNLVIRNCHREGWGLSGYSSRRSAQPAGNWPETPPAGEMARMQEMLRKMGG